MKFLPIGDTVDFKYRVNLEGVAYDIRTRWNSRSESWFLYIGPTGRDPALKTRITTNQNLLSSYTNNNLPSGKLYLLDVEKTFGRPSVDDVGLNKRFRLLYLNSDETDFITGLSDV